MGMDVSGRKPTTEAGKYFRNNVWWWRPLADYCCEVAPDITAKCTYWQSNDGDGLNARDSVKLADVLQREIDNGNTAAYAAIREAEIHRLPDERCEYCNATGVRDDRVGQENGFLDRTIPADAKNHPRAGQRGWCNACDGKGFRRPSDASYPFSVENVAEWIEFLRGCGGFTIY
jgi:hypothetical protein